MRTDKFFSESKEDSQNVDSCLRYCYPLSEKYSRLENDVVFNVLGGRNYESSISGEFKISINELIAFQINSEAKFTKVYREGVSKCFLMPAEFRDDVMRNFFRVKFEEFADISGNLIMKDKNHTMSFLSSRSSSPSVNADFERNIWRDAQFR